MATLDEIFAQADAELAAETSGAFTPTSTPSTGFSLQDIFDQGDREIGIVNKPKLGFIDTVAGGASNLLNGIALNYGDEIIGGAGGAAAKALDLISPLWGRPSSNLPISEFLSRGIQQSEDLRNQYKEENPYIGTGFEIAGGIANPLNRVFSLVKGNLPVRAAKQAALGAGLGGIAGLGENEDRLKNAMYGAALGGGLGVGAEIVGSTTGAGINKGLDYLAEKGITANSIGNKFSPQRGSISFNPVSGGEVPLSAGELYVARRLKGTPASEIEGGVNDLYEAIINDTPLFTPEALKVPNINRNAQYVANSEGGMDFAKRAITERTENTVGRLSNILDEVSPERSVFEASSQFGGGAKKIVGDIVDRRTEEANLLYSVARGEAPLVEDSIVLSLIETDKNLSNAIRKVKSFSINASQADNSLDVLHQAKGILDDKIENALSRGNNNEARLLSDTRNKLNASLENASETYKLANEKFFGGSLFLDALPKSIRLIGESGEINPKAVTNIFASKSPEEISTIRSVYEKAGQLDAFNAGLRAYIQDAVNVAKDGRNALPNIIGGEGRRQSIASALGVAPSELEKNPLYKKLLVEDLIGKSKYPEGSQTQGRLAEAQSVEGTIEKIKNVILHPRESLESFFKSEPSRELEEELSQIYFNPRRGGESLNRIIPLLENYQKNELIGSSLNSTIDRLSASLNSQGTISDALNNPNASLDRQFSPQGRSSTKISPPQEKFSNKKMVERLDRSGESRSSSGKMIDKQLEKVLPERLPKADSKSPQAAYEPDRKTYFSSSPNSQTNQDLSQQGNAMKYDDVNLDIVPKKQGDRVRYIESMIDQDPIDSTIYELESSRNPNAKNPKSTASGAFQHINATAKSLGIRDVFDIAENYKGYLKLKEENQEVISRLGLNPDSVENVYAVHNLGAPTFTKWVRGQSLTPKQQAQVKDLEKNILPKLRKIYEKVTNKKSTGLFEV